MGRIELEIYTPGYVPNGREVAVIDTARGTVRAELFGREVPVTVGNFIELAAKGFYDNLKFHAKKPGSVVLGGCPTTRTMGPAQVLAAAQGAIIDEWEGNPRNRHVLGSLCMAHKSAPNSGSCQFYFSLGEQPEFDDKYTVFGQVIEGLEVIEQLAIGDAIRSIAIEGADEEALAAAIARETPRPPTPQEALAAIERERAERAAGEAAAVAGEAAE